MLSFYYRNLFELCFCTVYVCEILYFYKKDNKNQASIVILDITYSLIVCFTHKIKMKMQLEELFIETKVTPFTINLLKFSMLLSAF